MWLSSKENCSLVDLVVRSISDRLKTRIFPFSSSFLSDATFYWDVFVSQRRLVCFGPTFFYFSLAKLFKILNIWRSSFFRIFQRFLCHPVTFEILIVYLLSYFISSSFFFWNSVIRRRMGELLGCMTGLNVYLGATFSTVFQLVRIHALAHFSKLFAPISFSLQSCTLHTSSAAFVSPSIRTLASRL